MDSACALMLCDVPVRRKPRPEMDEGAARKRLKEWLLCGLALQPFDADGTRQAHMDIGLREGCVYPPEKAEEERLEKEQQEEQNAKAQN